MDALDDVLTGNDPEADKRRRLLEISHARRDGGATRRLLEGGGTVNASHRDHLPVDLFLTEFDEELAQLLPPPPHVTSFSIHGTLPYHMDAET